MSMPEQGSHELLPELDLRDSPLSGRSISMRAPDDLNTCVRMPRRDLTKADDRKNKEANGPRDTRRSRSAREEVRES